MRRSFSEGGGEVRVFCSYRNGFDDRARAAEGLKGMVDKLVKYKPVEKPN